MGRYRDKTPEELLKLCKQNPAFLHGKCVSCRNFDEDPEDFHQGICRAQAPTPILADVNSPPMKVVWPLVEAFDGCFAQREDEKRGQRFYRRLLVMTGEEDL